MNYSELSNKEINAKVAFFRKEKLISYAPDKDWCQDADYCNTPNYAWPIILDNNINIENLKSRDYSVAYILDEDDYDDEFSAKDQNPLRAAMIVYLQLQEAEQ